jgi:hypothetical protein
LVPTASPLAVVIDVGGSELGLGAPRPGVVEFRTGLELKGEGNTDDDSKGILPNTIGLLLLALLTQLGLGWDDDVAAVVLEAGLSTSTPIVGGGRSSDGSCSICMPTPS